MRGGGKQGRNGKIPKSEGGEVHHHKPVTQTGNFWANNEMSNLHSNRITLDILKETKQSW